MIAVSCAVCDSSQDTGTKDACHGESSVSKQSPAESVVTGDCVGAVVASVTALGAGGLPNGDQNHPATPAASTTTTAITRFRTSGDPCRERDCSTAKT